MDKEKEIIGRIYGDKTLIALRRKINEGKGTFKDTADYSERAAELLGKYFSKDVLSLSAVERIAMNDSLLRDRYKDINELLDIVQTAADEAQGIHIRPQHAPYNEERADQIGRSLTDKTVSDEVIKRRAKSAPATAAKAMHDDYIKKNATFRNDAGLTCYIVREGSHCCPWCAEVAGKYKFGEQPDDIFRRHDNCDCTIIYDGQKLRGKQNADGSRSKTWEEVPDVPESKPTVLSEAEAREKERENMVQFRGLSQNQNYIISAKHSSNAYSVNRELVNSKLYHDKFEDITPHKATNENIYQQAKRLLEFRDGSENESLIVLDSRTGKLIVDNFENSDIKLKTGLTNEQYSYVTKHNGRFVILHNHPGSTRPSGTDILTLWREEKADCSIVAGHDGTVFLISEMDRKISLDKIYYDEYNKCIDMQFPRDFAAAKATDKLYETNAFVYQKR